MISTVGMVAGEPSGDLLAGEVLQCLNGIQPNIACEGIGGERMISKGFHAIHPLESLSVFGYVDALRSLPKLVRIYKDVKSHWLNSKPDVFLGIDAPDFNLRLEMQLKNAGIPTLQFVSPSIWAWRYKRIHKIRKAVSHMLVLFPFEEELYKKEGIEVTYVGHPLAKVIPKTTDKITARKRLGLPEEAKILAVMPGSRSSEIKMLANRFVDAIKILQAQNRHLHVLIPLNSEEKKQEFLQQLSGFLPANCTILLSSNSTNRPVSWDAMEACDAVLVASGTATLEAALFKRPMVISYVITPLMKQLMAWQSGQKAPLVPWVGLPNILAQEFIVPELLQEDATPSNLAEHTWRALEDNEYREDLVKKFTRLHDQLNRDTANIVAETIISHIK